MSNSFNAHLDVCPHCEQHPFDLCPTGAQLLTGVEVPRADIGIVMVNEQSAEKQVCAEILEIMETYREQEDSASGVDTPGGLEHMGDVWRLFLEWERLLKGQPR